MKSPAPILGGMTRGDAWIGGLLALGLVALLAPFASLGVDFHHDGIMLKPALDVLSGQVLFRDTFMQYGALTCYLQVLALWLQPTLLSLKLMAVGAYGVTLFFLYAAWRMVLPRLLAIVACLLFVLFVPVGEKYSARQIWIFLPWSSVLAMMFQSLGLYALFRVIRDEQPRDWALVLGLACAGVFWCRQPVGVLMFGSLAGIGLGLYLAKWRPAAAPAAALVGRFIAGFGLVSALLLGHIVLSGAGSDWWYQNFVWPRKWIQAGVNEDPAGYFFYFIHFGAAAKTALLWLAIAAPIWARRRWPFISRRTLVLYFLGFGALVLWQHERVLFALRLRDGGWSALVPCLIVVQVLISLRSAVGASQPPKDTGYYLVGALAIFSLASLAQYYPIADPWHVLWSLAPAFGLFVYMFQRATGWTPPVVTGTLLALCLPSLAQKAALFREAFAEPMVTLERPAPLRGMKVAPELARHIGQIDATLQDVMRYRPDIPSVLFGTDALYLCFTRNGTNPSPYFVTWAGLADGAATQQRWNFIAAVRPVLILQKAKWDAVNDFYRRSAYVPLLYLDEEAVEIAVPKEVADAMGRSAYGQVKSPSPP